MDHDLNSDALTSNEHDMHSIQDNESHQMNPLTALLCQAGTCKTQNGHANKASTVDLKLSWADQTKHQLLGNADKSLNDVQLCNENSKC